MQALADCAAVAHKVPEDCKGLGADLSPVIAGLDPAIHPLSETLFSMDALVISALARVFDALLPAHDD
jgi:hypothetical protein